MLTIEHSTLPIEMFLRALEESGCRTLVDVRTVIEVSRRQDFAGPYLRAL
jgi:hypothetical protein